MTTIGERLTGLEHDVKRLLRIAEETRRHAAQTNGRVHALERRQIEQDARDDERRRVARDLAEAAAARDAARRHWLPPIVIGVTCVTIAWALTHFIH